MLKSKGGFQCFLIIYKKGYSIFSCFQKFATLEISMATLYVVIFNFQCGGNPYEKLIELCKICTTRLINRSFMMIVALPLNFFPDHDLFPVNLLYHLFPVQNNAGVNWHTK